MEDASTKSLKERVNETPYFTPWNNGNYGDRFLNWYHWMHDQSNMQQTMWSMKMADAESLYSIMCNALCEAHRNHSVLGKVCNYSNHPKDCDCRGL